MIINFIDILEMIFYFVNFCENLKIYMKVVYVEKVGVIRNFSAVIKRKSTISGIWPGNTFRHFVQRVDILICRSVGFERLRKSFAEHLEFLGVFIFCSCNTKGVEIMTTK